MRAAVIFVKVQIGLGVLAIPAVMETLGLVIGIILIVVVAGLTNWANFFYYKFDKSLES